MGRALEEWIGMDISVHSHMPEKPIIDGPGLKKPICKG